MSLVKGRSSVTAVVVSIRVINRLAGFGMGYLGLRMADDLGVDLRTVGLLLGAFGLCTIPSRILGGLIAARWGPRAAIVIGLTASAAAQLVIGVATDLFSVVAGILALGLAYEIIEPATQGMLAENVSPQRLGSTFTLLSSALSIAGVLAGALAALILPHGVSMLFLVDGASSAVAALVAALLLPGTDSSTVGVRRSMRAALTAPILAWTGLATLYATLVMIIVFMLPLSVVASGLDASLTGWLLAVAAAASILAVRVMARLERRTAPRTILLWGHLLLALAVLCWVPGAASGYVVGAALEGACAGILLGTYQSTAAAMAPTGQATPTMAVFGLSWGVATTLAPVLGAPLLDRSPALLWLSVCAGSVALALVHGLAARTLPRTSDRSTAEFSHQS